MQNSDTFEQSKKLCGILCFSALGEAGNTKQHTHTDGLLETNESRKECEGFLGKFQHCCVS